MAFILILVEVANVLFRDVDNWPISCRAFVVVPFPLALLVFGPNLTVASMSVTYE